MNTILLLVRSHLWGHKTRTILTTLATAFSVSLLVWVVSIYSSAIASLDLYASRALGRYALVVDPISRKADREVPVTAVELLQDQSEVASVDPMWARLVSLRPYPPTNELETNRQFSMESGWEDVMIGTDAVEPPFQMARGRWINMTPSQQMEVVISQTLADTLNVDVGDQLEMPSPSITSPRLTIVGVIEPPLKTIAGALVGSRLLPSLSVGAVFCSMDNASAIHRTQPKISFIALALKDDVDVHEFRYRLIPKLYALKQPVQFMTDLDLEEEMSEAAKASSLALQAYVVGMIAVVLAFLIIFSTLSMGVGERARQFALLRAILLSKRQLAAMIAVEGLLLCALGLLIGIPLGGTIVAAFDQATEGEVRHGIQIDALGIVVATVVSSIAALIASILPAWRATRVKPLDAAASHAPSNDVADLGWSNWWLIIAAPLIGLLPLLSFVLPPGPDGSPFWRLIGGSFCMGAGFVLLTPILIRLVDRSCTRLLAWMLRLPSELLQQQMTSQ
ncbi:MAG: FtsX-like permease family protein, partial [Planctomycetota bacterium]